MDYFVGGLLFVFGIVFGSFFNVVGLRLPKGETFHRDRSYCPNCGQQLRYFELIPILSYLIQAGKCGRCRTKISIIYPAIELATGLLFVYSYVEVGLQVELLLILSFISMCMILVVSDLTYMLL